MADIPDIDEEPTNPDEAILEESEHVVSLEEDRYLVSPSVIDAETKESIKSFAEEEQTDTRQDHAKLDLDQARRQIKASLEHSPRQFTIELMGSLEGSTQHGRSETDDVVEAFDEMLRTFATGVGTDDMSIKEVISILLVESSLFEPQHSHDLGEVLNAYDLAPNDRIADLIDAVDQER